MVNALTVDVEDWYQSSTELFECGDKDKLVYPSKKAVSNTLHLLDLFDKHRAKATFFILGTVAEVFPQLVKQIYERGHEIATHGYAHKPVYRQTPEEFTKDLAKSIYLIEKITKERVIGYRAPYFSIIKRSFWALERIIEQGLQYDSSIFPIKRKLYGIPGSPIKPYVVCKKGNNNLLEFPISCLRIGNRSLPIGGGGYLRVFPYFYIKQGIERMNKQGIPAVIYLHPYELDVDKADLPKGCFTFRDRLVRRAQSFNRLKGKIKINSLLSDFKFTSLKGILPS